MILNLIELWRHIAKHRRKQFYLLLILMLIASMAEIISIGAILPFLGVLTAPEKVLHHPYTQTIIHKFSMIFDVGVITDPDQLMLPITIIFIVAVILAGMIRLTLLYVMTRISFATGADLSIKIYRNTLYQKYETHLEGNSSEIINGIITKTNTVIDGVLNPFLTLISSIILLIGIISALLIIDTRVAIIASAGFGLLYWFIILYTKTKLRENSKIISDKSDLMVKSIQEGLGGIRDVIIDGTQQFYCTLYNSADLPLRKAAGKNIFISGSPRYAMEAIGMSLIAGLAYFMMQQQDGMLTAIPILGALALGAQRLLPTLQQAYSAYSSIRGAMSSFEDVLRLLSQPLPEYADKPSLVPFKFAKKIELNNISFRYKEESSWVLKDINLTLTKGSRIGFIGATGSGKSTLLDIIMGLLPSTSGELTVDGSLITNKNRRSWQMHISHVPQNIYLSDSTVEQNIAFGISKDKINHSRVRKAAKQAQISELIEDWKEGYQTFVGERGVRLSGGQRQRIGIARALYKRADVLIFDEATSALDNETEQAVMKAIEELGDELTILIIAHRLTTLKGCDQIIKLDKNNIVRTGSYKEMIRV